MLPDGLPPYGKTEHQTLSCRQDDTRDTRLDVTLIITQWGVRFPRKVNRLGIRIGNPRSNTVWGGIFDTLVPTKADSANPKSLSKVYDVGEFPLHVDTAHWLKPCRYLVFGCVNPGSNARPSFLVDTRRLPLMDVQKSLLYSEPLRVTNGRNSFYSTVMSKTRPFIRFDRACMSSVTSEGASVLEMFSQYKWPNYIETIHWKPGMVLVIDNWLILHGRARLDHSDLDRKLIRVSVL
jgi:hypothetical protein